MDDQKGLIHCFIFFLFLSTRRVNRNFLTCKKTKQFLQGRRAYEPRLCRSVGNSVGRNRYTSACARPFYCYTHTTAYHLHRRCRRRLIMQDNVDFLNLLVLYRCDYRIRRSGLKRKINKIAYLLAIKKQIFFLNCLCRC